MKPKALLTAAAIYLAFIGIMIQLSPAMVFGLDANVPALLLGNIRVTGSTVLVVALINWLSRNADASPRTRCSLPWHNGPVCVCSHRRFHSFNDAWRRSKWFCIRFYQPVLRHRLLCGKPRKYVNPWYYSLDFSVAYALSHRTISVTPLAVVDHCQPHRFCFGWNRLGTAPGFQPEQRHGPLCSGEPFWGLAFTRLVVFSLLHHV